MIDTAKAVWSEATYKGHEGGEARIAEPPASGQRMFQDIDSAKAVWSEATRGEDGLSAY